MNLCELQDRSPSDWGKAARRRRLGACLAMNGASPKGVLKPARHSAARAGAAVDAQSVLVYIKNYAGSSGEQIAREAGTDTATLRPVLRELIAAGEITTSGKGRGTRYAAG